MILVAGGYLELSNLHLETSGFRMLSGLLLTGGGLAYMRAASVPAATQTLPIRPAWSGVKPSRSGTPHWREFCLSGGRQPNCATARNGIPLELVTHVSRLSAIRDHRLSQSNDGSSRGQWMGLHGAENGASRRSYHLVENQSRMQAYNDIFLVSGLLFLCRANHWRF